MQSVSQYVHDKMDIADKDPEGAKLDGSVLMVAGKHLGPEYSDFNYWVFLRRTSEELRTAREVVGFDTVDECVNKLGSDLLHACGASGFSLSKMRSSLVGTLGGDS